MTPAKTTHSADDVGCLVVEIPGSLQEGGWKLYAVSFWEYGRVWRSCGTWQFPPSITCLAEMHACAPVNWHEMPFAS